MGMNLKDALDVQRASKWRKFRARLGAKVYLGEETRPGWSGYLPFYLFQCPECKMLVKDYPHGHPERQYLYCPECGAHIDFVRFWVGLKELFSILFFACKMRFSKR